MGNRQPHAMSRYTAVTEAVIEKCQQDYRAGRDLGRSVPGLSATEAAVIVAESLEADRLINMPPHEFLKRRFGSLSDWGLAVLAELFFQVAKEARTMKGIPEEQQSEKRGREAEVDPEVLADFRAALTIDFDAGHRRPITELCWELVPDLDQVPVKRPPEMPDLPPPGAPDQGRRPSQASQKLGRNDPCWCGSGRKYKHCHMRSDRDL